MLGIVVQLILSWAILQWYDKSSLSVLGLRPTTSRMGMLLFFFMVSALCATSGYLARLYFGREVWALNPDLNWSLFGAGVWWNIKSVLFEELIFRGALFWILMDRLGASKAILISSIAFGIYHWFSMGVLGQPLPMLMIFVLSGLAGAVYAYGFVRSGTLFVPIAMHLGWNLVGNFVFSEGQIGKGVLVMKEQPVLNVSWFTYYLAVWNPLVIFLLLNYFLVRRLARRNR